MASFLLASPIFFPIAKTSNGKLDSLGLTTRHYQPIWDLQALARQLHLVCIPECALHIPAMEEVPHRVSLYDEIALDLFNVKISKARSS